MPDNRLFYGSIGSSEHGQAMIFHSGTRQTVTVSAFRDGKEVSINMTSPEIHALIGLLQGVNMRLRDGEK